MAPSFVSFFKQSLQIIRINKIFAVVVVVVVVVAAVVLMGC